MFNLDLVWLNNCISGDRRIDVLHSYYKDTASRENLLSNMPTILRLLKDILNSMTEGQIQTFTKEQFCKLNDVLLLLTEIAEMQMKELEAKHNGKQNPIIIFQNSTLPYSFYHDAYKTYLYNNHNLKYISGKYVCEIVTCLLDGYKDVAGADEHESQKDTEDDSRPETSFLPANVPLRTQAPLAPAPVQMREVAGNDNNYKWKFILNLVRYSNFDYICFLNKERKNFADVTKYVMGILTLIYKFTTEHDRVIKEILFMKLALFTLFSTIYTQIEMSYRYEDNDSIKDTLKESFSNEIVVSAHACRFETQFVIYH